MPSQKDMDAVFMDIVNSIATLSNCVKYKVGAVIVNDGRIISHGYNGTPPGAPNCSSVFKMFNSPTLSESQQQTMRRDHRMWSLTNEVHAEVNAIAFAAKNGISVNGATLYSTLQPCDNCKKIIIASGIKRVVYGTKYINAAPVDESLIKYEHFEVE